MPNRITPPHIERFIIRANEVDMLNRLTVPALVNFLQEAAHWNAHNLGFSSQVLQERGLSWVLARMRIECFGWPQLRDEVQVLTFPSGIDKYYCYRDYRVLDTNGRLIAQVTSSWPVIDLEKRQMISVPDFIREFPVAQETPLPRASGKIGSVDQADYTANFQAGWHQMDNNRHTNNMYYIQWLIETLPGDFLTQYQLKSLDIMFRMESNLGHTIEGRAVRETESENPQFRHSLLLADTGKELIQARTIWS
ncbi:acyl-[acyl-carrier-protein] thioesterase [Rhodoflexus sp.]